LSFPRGLEAEYAAFRNRKPPRTVRLTLLAVMLFYAGYFFLGFELYPADRRFEWIASALICFASLSVALGASIHPAFRKWMQPGLAALIAAAGGGLVITATMAGVPGGDARAAALVLLVLFGYAGLGIGFFWASLAGWSVLGLFHLVSLRVHEPDMTYVLVGANLLGMLAGYVLEYRARRTWLLDRALETGPDAENRDSGGGTIQALRSEIQTLREGETKLRAAKERLQILFDQAPEGYYLFEPEGVFVGGNRAAEALTGYPIDELIGRNFLELDIVPPESRAQASDLLAESVAGHSTGPVRMLVNRKDGAQICVEVQNRPLKIEGRRFILSSARDASERREVERDLKDNERFFDTLFNAIQDGICVLDTDLNIVRHNLAMERLYPDRVRLVGRKCHEAFRDRNEPCAACPILRAMDDGRMHTGMVPLIRGDVQTGWLELFGYPILDQADEVTGVVQYVRDVTERRRAETELAESEARYRQLVDHAPAGIGEIDTETGRLISVNDLMCRLTGYSKEEFLNMNFTELLEPDHRKAFSAIITGIEAGGTAPDNIEMKVRGHSGRERWVLFTLRLANDPGRPGRVTIVAHDNTEGKRMEEELRRRNQELGLLHQAGQALNSVLDLDQVLTIYLEEVRRLMNVTGSSIWLLDPESGGLFCRLAAGPYSEMLRGWRLEPGEGLSGWVAQNGRYLVVSDVRDDERHAWRVDRMTGLDIRSVLAVPIRAKDEMLGVLQIVDTQVGRFGYPDLRLIEPLTAAAAVAIENARLYEQARQEIAERRRAEEALLKSEEKYGTILENIGDGYYEMDLENRFTFINIALSKILGQAREEIMGSNIRRFLVGTFHAEAEDTFLRVLQSGRSTNVFDWEMHKADGRRCTLEVSISPLQDSAGETIGFRGLVRDVTEKERAMALQHEKMAAESASRAKSEFLANMSHEIRTPLNGIVGMVELAMDTELDDNQRGILETINREATSLVGLINDILDFSKIEAERLVLEHIPFELRYLIEDVANSISMGAEEKGLEFISYLGPNVPSPLIGDPGRLRQILVNLAGNALKFTERGEIFIKGVLDEDLGNQVRIRFVVRDTGIGIPPEKHASIFDLFTQADGSTTRRYGGTGLGTTISKQLVELMGGEIGLESDPGRGSTFWFTVHFDKQDGAKPPLPKGGVDLSGLDVLVVDDNPTYRTVLSDYLRHWGCRPVEAGHGGQALERLSEADAAGAPFGLIITDIRMPGLSGFDLAENIRTHEAWRLIPIVVLSTVGRPGDGARCREIGIEGYLTKPVRWEELHAAIRAALGLAGGDEEQPGNRPVTRHSLSEKERRGLRILLVEDYPTNQKVALRHLKGAGYNVDLAENGDQAVEMFKRKAYDLVLMDVQMPVMDGYEATAAIRAIESRAARVGSQDPSPSFPSAPIIAMTAHAVKGDREKCLEAGMDDYMTKPLRRQDLLSMTDKWLKHTAREDRDEAYRPDAEAVGSGEPDLDAPMNLERAVEEFEGDREFLMEVLNEFLQNVRNQIQLLRRAIETGDADQVRREAHAIKGGAANLAAMDLSRAAMELEEIGKSGELDTAPGILDMLENEFFMLDVFASEL
ncbi:MAG: PAS domain S-box protein, partial [Proteobacteria bacterium]|nr:PAS domain S-box protein [Pseudomonadota bacterium]